MLLWVWSKYDHNELFNSKKYLNIPCVRGVNPSRTKIRIPFRKDMACIMWYLRQTFTCIDFDVTMHRCVKHSMFRVSRTLDFEQYVIWCWQQYYVELLTILSVLSSLYISVLKNVITILYDLHQLKHFF